jgi:hypothetical protein
VTAAAIVMLETIILLEVLALIVVVSKLVSGERLNRLAASDPEAFGN